MPVILVAGDSDKVVPYCENGIMIEKEYENPGIPFCLYIKEGCDHHPHGLEDNTPIINFVEKYSK